MKTGKFVLVYELQQHDNPDTPIIHLQRFLSEWAMKARAVHLMNEHGSNMDILLAGCLSLEYQINTPTFQTLNA